MSLTELLLALILLTLIADSQTAKGLIKLAFMFCVLLPFEYAKSAAKALTNGGFGKAYTVAIALFVAIAAAYSFMIV